MTDDASRAASWVLAATILGSSIELARQLHLESVAEGVETDGQARFLTELGCTEGQGYLFGRPMTEDMVHEHLSGERMGWQVHPRRLFGTAS